MIQKKKGLGRGLDALIPSSSKTSNKENFIRNSSNGFDLNKKINEFTSDINIEKTILNIDIEDIQAKKNQPRKFFDDKKIIELSESIKEYGIIQPLLVEKTKQGYTLIAGERRLRAAKEAGLKSVPCIMKDLSSKDNMLLTIIENMQREDLNPIEEAEGLEQMIEIYAMTQEEIAKSVGKSRTYVTNSLRLLKLPKEIRELVAMGVITNGHGRCLIPIKDKIIQLDIVKQIVDRNLSVRETEKLVNSLNNNSDKKEKKKKEKDEEVVKLEKLLKDIYKTKVNIKQKGKKGIIELEYKNKDDLERILALLK